MHMNNAMRTMDRYDHGSCALPGGGTQPGEVNDTSGVSSGNGEVGQCGNGSM